MVALRKESVDRNDRRFRTIHNAKMSLSARRAWIEIAKPFREQFKYVSLSARRAWIEIPITGEAGLPLTVALRKESVDRNSVFASPLSIFWMSLSARRAWIEI